MRRFLLGVLLVCMVHGAWADGTLTHLSGQVSILRKQGGTVPAKPGDEVQTGDTVVTGNDGYVRLQLTDGGEMLLRQDSQLKIENYHYDAAKPEEDSLVFRLVKGGLRTVTGLISKRGNRDAYQMRASVATIGIRGTQYDLRLCQGNCGSLPDGTYVGVRYGEVSASNDMGSMNFAAGKFGFVPGDKPPQPLPNDPGIGFKPPGDFPKLSEKKTGEAGNDKTVDNGDDTGASCAIQ